MLHRTTSQTRGSISSPGIRGVLIVALAATVLAACATSLRKADDLAAREQWTEALVEYRRALSNDPTSIEYRSRLQQAELRAADYYYQRGARLAAQGKLDEAVVEFQKGLVAIPDHSKLLRAMEDALGRREADALYQEARALIEAGGSADARRLLERALSAFPDHPQASTALAELRRNEDEGAGEGLALSSRAPITLNFRQTELRTAFEFIAKSFGVNVVFDEAMKPVPVTLFAKDVTFEQALQLLLTTTKTFYKPVGANTIVVAPDSKEKRTQYEEHRLRTFYVSNLKAKDMGEILKGVFALKKMTVNEQANSLVVRDTEEVLTLVEKLIANSDRRPAEMLLEVEILEVNRNKAEQLGLDFGQQITVQYDKFPASGSWRQAFRGGTVTLPGTTLRFFKQDVDAKILANPKVRVLNGRTAKIHIGDRVPLRASTIVDATGQTRTTYEYRDIGVKLTVEPVVHLDHSATVKMNLEVSALGQDLGTPDEPAFSIGTRNAETQMLLRDGETAILGGLIRDEERNNRVKLPGFGDIPIIGSLFTTYDDSRARTDVLLTITPRVVRGWELPAVAAREFYSGTDGVYTTKPLFAYLGPGASVSGAGTSVTASASTAVAGGQTASASVTAGTSATANAPSVAGGNPSPDGGNQPATPVASFPVIQFSQSLYQVGGGQEFEVQIAASRLGGAESAGFEIIYNPQLLRFVAGQGGTVSGTTPGSVRVSANFGAPTENAPIGRITFRALNPGVLYLIPRAPVVVMPDGSRVAAQVQAARVVIR